MLLISEKAFSDSLSMMFAKGFVSNGTVYLSFILHFCKGLWGSLWYMNKQNKTKQNKTHKSETMQKEENTPTT